MFCRRFIAAWLLLLVMAGAPAPGQEKPAPAGQKHQSLIWKNPGDIKAKDMFNGPGGERHRPELPLKFLTEDSHGHNSKFDVEDAKGKKWKAKLGIEAQPEIVASRLLWAIGYFTNENYFVRDLQVEGLPAHLKRGQGHAISPDHLDYARLQRHLDHEKKSATWDWRHNPFIGTREFNGLRVMMALLSNWDLKTENNAIVTDGEGDDEYMVSDVGTAFGASGQRWIEGETKNNLQQYQKARFIARATPEFVDFNFPRRSPLLHLAVALPGYIHQFRMHWIGNHVPRSDAKWVGSLLAQLSPEQIQDAFRAAGYSPEQITAFTQVLQARIAELNKL